ncbi:ribosomal protein L32 (nucleomorph) [Bigelowiella natans]|uniref:Ribosomal protein L32 n=1 Tax=Bigelowiella natans TaxID=227086 RepID=Q3LWI6_BIGNA|nr:ribosomal protein L32 [Bigelowiella natans]ABA27180.1 ribosomal protein L32 [Bigelowiella natans]
MGKSFLKHNSKSLIRIKKKWRKPIGIDSKIRKRTKGAPKTPKIGYGSSKRIKSLNATGLKTIHVFNLNDIKSSIILKRSYSYCLSKNISLKNKKLIRYFSNQVYQK